MWNVEQAAELTLTPVQRSCVFLIDPRFKLVEGAITDKRQYVVGGERATQVYLQHRSFAPVAHHPAGCRRILRAIPGAEGDSRDAAVLLW